MAGRTSSYALEGRLSRRAITIILVVFLQEPLSVLAQAPDLSGRWDLDMPNQNIEAILAIKQNGDTVTGVVRLKGQSKEIDDGVVRGGTFSYAVDIDLYFADHPDKPVTHKYAFSATIKANDRLEGCTYSVDGDSSGYDCSLVKRGTQ